MVSFWVKSSGVSHLWLINFNGTPIRLGLFYADKFENCVHWTHEIIFKHIWHVDETLKGTTTLSLSGPGSNGNKGVFLTLQISRTGASSSDAIECHYQDILLRAVLIFCRGFKSPVDNFVSLSTERSPRGVVGNMLDCNIFVKWVRTPVAQLRSLSDWYFWEKYEFPYPPPNTVVLLQ